MQPGTGSFRRIGEQPRGASEPCDRLGGLPGCTEACGGPEGGVSGEGCEGERCRQGRVELWVVWGSAGEGQQVHLQCTVLLRLNLSLRVARGAYPTTANVRQTTPKQCPEI